ncbi:hypothetical protein Mic7113_4944 [Allocoleopsis franciscana PCC 7113]|uniref:Uncharacterized protein n=1 Tax=Allocoleopsis franciscana PCC 7113 TaxID=1173027 RepID=K9WJP3_9CYAN|nr:hypothetical protein Mic7113_4944 [Allocoleopsis franciscana PCC 7113]
MIQQEELQKPTQFQEQVERARFRQTDTIDNVVD